MRKNNGFSIAGARETQRFAHRLASKVSMGTALWLAVVASGSHSECAKASDYGYTGGRQNQSWAGEQNNYSTRWARDTKPWSREPSTGEQSRFGGEGNGYSTDYNNNRWEHESSGPGRYAEGTPRMNDPWQSSDGWDEWHREPPVKTHRPPETEQKTAQWGSEPVQRPAPDKANPWARPQPASDSWDDRWPESAPRSQGNWSSGNESNRSANTYGGASQRNRPQPAQFGQPRDYSTGGPLSAKPSAKPGGSWGRDPWSAQDSQRGSKTHAWDPGQDRRGRQAYEENRPWGKHQRKNEPRPRQRSGSGAYTTPFSDGARSGHSEYLGYPNDSGYPGYSTPYSGMPAYGSGYGTGYGHEIYGPEYTYGPGGSYPGLWNVPSVGDLLGFPF